MKDARHRQHSPQPTPQATRTGRLPARAFAAVPYPGARPPGSFVVANGMVWGLDAHGGNWVDRETGEIVSLRGRELVLAYGSNGNPEKLTQKLDGAVLVLRCRMRHHAAVWCQARRSDDTVVATLVADPGHVEMHHVLAVTRHQLEAIDDWEGHPSVYRRIAMPAGSVIPESGAAPSVVWAYVGTQRRPPLIVDDAPLCTAEHSYESVDALVRPRNRALL